MRKIIQARLAAAYTRGDYKTALKKELLTLAEQGYAAAQNSLGVMYNKGQGVTQDYAEAAKWYRMAAEQGYAKAQFNLGELYHLGYYFGDSVTLDNAEAAKWCRMAAEQGHAEAQNILGELYDFGHGVTQDHVRAHMWANLANANGFEAAEDLRDSLEADMTPADISKARTMASECLESDYENCGD